MALLEAYDVMMKDPKRLPCWASSKRQNLLSSFRSSFIGGRLGVKAFLLGDARPCLFLVSRETPSRSRGRNSDFWFTQKPVVVTLAVNNKGERDSLKLSSRIFF
jgi:hypothetical protein